jgi:hypothetical protein
MNTYGVQMTPKFIKLEDTSAKITTTKRLMIERTKYSSMDCYGYNPANDEEQETKEKKPTPTASSGSCKLFVCFC